MQDDLDMGAKLLIATGAVAVEPEGLPFGVRVLIDAAEEILVVSPRLATRIDWITSDTDRAKLHADLGIPATGTIGADDPLVALEDAVRSFGPDHLLIALRSRTQSDWQERGLLDRIEERIAIPVTAFRLPFAD
jgi:hypothetical protein